MTDQEVIRHMIALNNKDKLTSDFSAHGKPVQDLSKDGYHEMAKLLGGFETVSYTDKESDEHYMATVLIKWNCGDLPNSGALGSAQVEKHEEYEDYKTKEQKQRVDPEAYTKVMHIAQRNALSHLIPEYLKVPVLDFYFKRGNAIARQRNELMQLVTNRKGMIEKHFGNMDAFWTEFQARYDDAAWVDLTEAHLDDAIRALKTNKTMDTLAEWVREKYKAPEQEGGK